MLSALVCTSLTLWNLKNPDWDSIKKRHKTFIIIIIILISWHWMAQWQTLRRPVMLAAWVRFLSLTYRIAHPELSCLMSMQATSWLGNVYLSHHQWFRADLWVIWGKCKIIDFSCTESLKFTKKKSETEYHALLTMSLLSFWNFHENFFQIILIRRSTDCFTGEYRRTFSRERWNFCDVVDIIVLLRWQQQQQRQQQLVYHCYLNLRQQQVRLLFQNLRFQ